MLKWLMVAAVILLPTVSNSTKNNHSPGLTQSGGDNKSTPSVSFVNNETSYPNTGAKQESPNWYKQPEVWLCIIGGLTLVFVGWQAAATASAAQATRDSAAAMLKSVRLQELGMGQSAYLTNWKVNKLKSDPRKLRLTVDLVNQSPLPMKLSEGNLLVGGNTRYSIGEATFLPPKAPMQIEIIVAGVPEQITEFDNGKLHLRVAGGFSHIDRISGKTIDQPFNGRLHCGWWGTLFHWELHMNPVESKPPEEAAAEGQSPN
jgi:hypothetical protein